LLESGRLEGKVQELFRGALAYHERRTLLNRTEAGWVQMNEAFLSRRLPGAILTSMGVKGLDSGDSLNEAYEFRAPFFAHRGGDDVLLVRPCVLGSRVVRLRSGSEREHPLQFIYLRLYSDSFDIALPDGAVVGTIPEPVELDLPFARYRSSVEHEGNLLKYSRSLEIKKLELNADTVGLLNEFYQLVDRDERSVVMVRLANQDASLR
jgi:hypothetical protein